MCNTNRVTRSDERCRWWGGGAGLEEYWVAASLDAGWVAQKLSAVSRGPEGGRYPTGLVTVGDVALVAWIDGTFTRVVAS